MQEVAGSIPAGGSKKLGGFQSGQMGRTVNPLLRLRRFESFSPHFNLIISGSSSIGRAIAFQAIGCGFETRLPLFTFEKICLTGYLFAVKKTSRCSSAVEHFLGKEEVMGSSPIIGS